ncbi:MAG: ABC transporter ATP-binding protein [bacterium]|nr:MAG: ABC transporter ATP-binding protein [bacterium]
MEKSDARIEVKELRKRFYVDESGKGFIGSLKALFNRRKRIIDAIDGISFKIRHGEFVGYVGENGAGKSTTIKILTGILVPSSGVARVNSVIPYKDRKNNAMNIGVVFGQRTQLWWDLPVRESFDLLRVIYRVKTSDFNSMRKLLTSTLDLGPLLDMPVRKLSLGQRMRCDIAASLLHKPGVLFLDEPTIGLDVLAKENIRSFLAEINRKEGTTIILTTHDMNDIEKLCRRLIILDRGRIIYDGATEALKRKFVHDKLIEVEFHQKLDSLPGVPELTVIREEGNKKWLKFQNGNFGIGEIIGKLANLYPVKDISVREPSVENIIRSIYEKTSTLPEPSETAAPDDEAKDGKL